ncbi:hypothetical protein [Clostridium cylindrosporum]|uniref:ABC-2 family transporter protein n=1 Tax=Clostridium cylindrosporum DSM 605 TaxID=1121307 RepID=A0A0J8D8H6_CLOCY|nr:hypothetical protein [Clostridium cylindrosporum]KMT22360.1 hypothetical protein CLCY_18c00060 [Clostridium cylindrosporum DSM 605]
MRESGMTNGYSIFFKGVRDWTSTDVITMEKFMFIQVIFGITSAILKNEYVYFIFEIYSIITFYYFIIAPLYIYHRNFKTDEERYIYLTPIKKSYVLLKSLGVWAIGFTLFMMLKFFFTFININSVVDMSGTNFKYLLLVLVNIIIFILGIYLIIISTDIITVVKDVPRVITYPVATLIIFGRGFFPDFLTYSVWSKFNMLNLILNPGGLQSNNFLIEDRVVLGPNIVIFIIGILLFAYSLSIFEGYNGEKVKGFFRVKN